MEDVEEEVFGKLGVLTVNGELKLPDIEVKKVKSHVLKVILKFLSSEEASDAGQSYFLRIKKFIDEKGKPDKDTKKGIVGNSGKTGSFEEAADISTKSLKQF